MFTLISSLQKVSIYAPTKYIINGSMRTPMANISQTFDAAFDLENNLAFVGYYNNMSYTIWNGKVNHVFTEYDHLSCTGIINGQNDSEASITTMLPDFTQNWEYVNQEVKRGVVCNHYVYKYTEKYTSDNAEYIATVPSQQDYWCQPGADDVCTPIQFDLRSQNTVMGSHYDYYSFEYYNFIPNPTLTADMFVAPQICQDTTQVTNLYGNDLLFTVLTQDAIANSRLQKIKEMKQNKQFSFQISDNGFEKMTHEQFLKLNTGYKHTDPRTIEGLTKYVSKLSADEIVPAIDWRVAGDGQLVTKIKDQNSCGSCWAHATSEVLETAVNQQIAGKNIPKVEVSPQEIMSCVWFDNVEDPDNTIAGCNGGDTYTTLVQMKAQFDGKIPMTAKSPYLGVESICDQSAWTDQYGTIDTVEYIDPSQSTEDRIQQLKEWLQDGPVAISIAVPESLSFYTSGIYNDPACGYGSEAELVHAVEVIGYSYQGTSDNATYYWIVRNSWQSTWGQQGVIYIAMDNDLCGVTQAAVRVTLAQQNASETQQYHFKGTFSLPLNNITKEIEVYFDEENNREKISYFNDSDVTAWNLNNATVPYYNTITYLPEGQRYSEQYCSLDPTYGNDPSALTPILPDLSNWTQVEDTTIMGQKVSHFIIQVVDEPSDNPARVTKDSDTPIFGYTKSDQQDYYCQNVKVLTNGTPVCDPVRWEIHGYNTIFGSHYDYYLIEFDIFERDPMFNASTFEVPAGLDCVHPALTLPITNTNMVSQAIAKFNKAGEIKNSIKQKHLEMIQAHNAKSDKTFTMAPNAFINEDFEQFKHAHTGYISRRLRDSATLPHEVPNNFPEVDPNGQWFINESTGIKQKFQPIDWRTIQRTTNPYVWSQADCGSCYAFGSSAALNARINIMLEERKQQKLTQLDSIRELEDTQGASEELFFQSQQAMVDCLWVYDDTSVSKYGGYQLGCSGGFAPAVYEEIITKFNGRLAEYKYYPYVAVEQPCKYNNWNYSQILLRNYSTTAPNNTGELKYALTQGPLTIAITVAEDLMFYSGGIYYSELCYNDVDTIDHQVTLIGWGKSESTGEEYWIVENSWSSYWGQDGYVMISMKNNICGVTLETTIPNLEWNQ